MLPRAAHELLRSGLERDKKRSGAVLNPHGLQVTRQFVDKINISVDSPFATAERVSAVVIAGSQKKTTRLGHLLAQAIFNRLLRVERGGTQLVSDVV